MRNELTIDWDALLDPLQNSVDAQFTVFQEKLMAATEKFIPYCHANSGTKSNRPPMDKKVRKLNRRKNRLWTRYMETCDIDKYKEYCRCHNKVRSTRCARKNLNSK